MMIPNDPLGDLALALAMYDRGKSDAEKERKTGKWIENGVFWKCSVCGENELLECHDNYCPNCGARMKGEDDDTD